MWRPAAKQTWPWNWNDGVGAGGGGGVEVGVVEHDERVVAAELERDLLEQAAGELADAPAGRRRAGERDDVHVRVGDERLADVGAADDDLEQALGQAGLAEDGLEHRAAARPASAGPA